MRPGPLEIGIIILVILLVTVVMRIVRVGRSDTKKGKKSSAEIVERQPGQSLVKIRRHLRLPGIAFILTSLLLLLGGISLLKWVFWSYLWSFIVMAIGLALVLMSVNRQR